MSANTSPEETLHHHTRPMSGRDPHERNRVATPLELLFDLTFASSFGLAAAQFAHLLAEGHYAAALLGFGFSSFAICWAWINFSWFSSAYDTDDWSFRIVTMIQMIGVVILALGLPQMFTSLEHGEHLDNTVIVLGYVVMRVAMVYQWLRAARQDPGRRRACLTYAIAISVAQVGWIIQILVNASIADMLSFAAVLAVIELAGPVMAERKPTGAGPLPGDTARSSSSLPSSRPAPGSTPRPISSNTKPISAPFPPCCARPFRWRCSLGRPMRSMYISCSGSTPSTAGCWRQPPPS